MATVKVIEGAAGQGSSPEEREADLARKVGSAQETFRKAMVVAGLKDDPLAPLVKVMGDSLGIQHEIHVATVNQLQAVVPGIAQQAALAAHREAVRLARAHNLRTVLVAASVLVGSIVAAGGVGYWWGSTSMAASVHETEAGLADAFRAGPNAAAGWVNLMRLNDLPSALATCRGGRAFMDTTGAAACYVPLRLAPPQPEVAAKPGQDR